MKELPLILKETLLLPMPGSQRSFRLFPVFVRLERRLPLDALLVLGQSLLLPVEVLCLLQSEALLDAERRVTRWSSDAMPLGLEELIRFP